MPTPDLADVLVILFVVFLIFGAAKIPALGEAIGRGLSLPPKGGKRKGG